MQIAMAVICGGAGLAALACSDRSAPASRDGAAKDLAGCYEFVMGPPLHWRPTAWSRVDTAAGARLRVLLTAAPDTDPMNPQRSVFRVRPSRDYEPYVWWPTRVGLSVAQYGVDTRFAWELRGGPANLSGGGRSEGTIEGGPYRYALLGHRVDCQGFEPGYDAPGPRHAPPGA